MTNFNLESHGIKNVKKIFRNLSVSSLYEESLSRGEGCLGDSGQMLVKTGAYTGRSPNDKFIVKENSSKEDIHWGKVNRPFDEQNFDKIYARLCKYLEGKDVFVQDCLAGANLDYQIKTRIITEFAWHSIFAHNMFINIKDLGKLENFTPDFTVINVPNFHGNPETEGTNSEAFILVNFGKKLVIIGGTSYAGETKKSVFSILNYLLPQKNILSMHCSANTTKDNNVALFFGLSGTGKTTLSAVPDRKLIGDDEHGWSENGVFNFEGGCYAKVINLSKKSEPEIYKCSKTFGTILENVVFESDSRKTDFFDSTFTVNTRAGYPITHLDNAIENGLGGHPKNIFMLTCDAFGVMPPISKLSVEQAMYYFLSGYTAKIAGTERGMGKQPEATFSSCFGEPFMVLRPTVYAELLGENIRKHNVNCWLLNTGWSGGPFGVGKRLKIEDSRAMISSAISGALDKATYHTDPIFGLKVPEACDGVQSEILIPKNTWTDKEAYNEKAKKLAGNFRENFKQFSEYVNKEITNAGPNS